MGYAEEIVQYRAKVARMNPEFRDVTGTQVYVGSVVHYTEDRTTEEFVSPWTPDRWGVVTGLIQTPSLDGSGTDRTVRVSGPVAVSSRAEGQFESRDEWYCDPARLEVV